MLVSHVVLTTSEAKLQRSLEPKDSFFDQKEKGCRVWWHIPLIPALCASEASLGHTVRLCQKN